MTTEKRCPATVRITSVHRCTLPAGHTGTHLNANLTWDGGDGELERRWDAGELFTASEFARLCRELEAIHETGVFEEMLVELLEQWQSRLETNAVNAALTAAGVLTGADADALLESLEKNVCSPEEMKRREDVAQRWMDELREKGFITVTLPAREKR